MLTEKDYCDYETCRALEELGFNSTNNEYFQSKIVSKEIPLKFFDTTLQGTSLEYAPIITLYEAQKWLREEKRICVEVDCCASGYIWELCKAYQENWFSGGTTIYTHYCEDYANNPLLNDYGKYNSYEDALLDDIKEAVKILFEKHLNDDNRRN